MLWRQLFLPSTPVLYFSIDAVLTLPIDRVITVPHWEEWHIGPFPTRSYYINLLNEEPPRITHFWKAHGPALNSNKRKQHIDGSVQDYSNSSVLAIELLQFYTKLSMLNYKK